MNESLLQKLKTPAVRHEKQFSLDLVQTQALNSMSIDVEDMKLSKDEPQDEPEGGPEVVEKTRVWYRGSCSLNNEKVVEFNGTFQMEQNDAFKPVKNALEFNYPGVYLISFTDGFGNNRSGILKFTFSGPGLDF